MFRHHEPNRTVAERTMTLARPLLHHLFIIRRTTNIVIIILPIFNNQPFFYSTLQLFSLSFPKWTASDEQQLQQQHGRSHDRSNDCGRVTMIPCNVATTSCRCTILSSTFTPHHWLSHNDNNNNRMMMRHDDTLQCVSPSVINRQPLHDTNNRMMTQQHYYYYCFPLIYHIPNGRTTTLLLLFS